jgi:hypothetical protein
LRSSTIRNQRGFILDPEPSWITAGNLKFHCVLRSSR